jgi:hypothetical protein
VGKGKDKRAYSTFSRNDRWNKTANKHGLIVEIVFDELEETDAFQVERDTILEMKYFGYPLVNMTEGGDGISGFKHSVETKKKQSEKMLLSYNKEIANNLANGVREYYKNNKCIKKFSGKPWEHPNASPKIWTNLQLFYDYYSICNVSQSTLEHIFGVSLESAYKLLKTGFKPSQSNSWLIYKNSNQQHVLSENPRKVFWEVPLDDTFDNILNIENLVDKGKGYILISKELGITGGSTQRIVSRLKTGYRYSLDDKYIFVQQRIRSLNGTT